jgi:hypothetical protein
MAEVAEPGIMVGYAINGKGYRILMDDAPSRTAEMSPSTRTPSLERKKTYPGC